MEKVSVILPVYNGEKYLCRCINSLIKQSYPNIEIIILNDGSTDSSLKIINKYAKKDKRIRVVEKKNSGVSDTRNLGIKKSTGKYICFCDCDDIYSKDYIQVMYNCIKKQNVAVVKCNYKVVDNKDCLISKGYIENDICNKKLSNKQIHKSVIPKCLDGSIPCFSYLLMIDKEKLKVEYPVDIAMMEDVVFYLRLLFSINNMYIINNDLYTVMFNDEGATNNKKNYKRNIFNILSVNDYIVKILNEKGLYNTYNINCLNKNNLNAIADFIFKYYLYNDDDVILLCKEINNDKFKNIVYNTKIDEINIQRRFIIKYIFQKRYIFLKIYLKIRKIIFNLKRR